jgi:exonuclease III
MCSNALMRVLAWNMDHWKRPADQRDAAWHFLEEQQPTVALLQEARPLGQHFATVYSEAGSARAWGWGSAVIAPGLAIEAVTSVKAGRKTFDVVRSHQGAFAIAEVDVPSVGMITCVSIYGQLDSQSWARTTVHRSLSDLSLLLHARRNEFLALGGDLNASTQLDRPYRYYDRNLFERIELFGLVDLLGATASRRPALSDCPCEDEPCRHVQTHQHPRSRVPWQNDYLYATRNLADRLTACGVVEAGDPPWSLSDHRPVVADLT